MSEIDPPLPLVSCLVVTADRAALLRRAVRCYNRQSYPRRELVVLDDGSEDLEPALRDVPTSELRYHRIERQPANVLGALRNQTLDLASGEYVAQWDDDDWYHADRLAVQVGALEEGHDACTLTATLMHLDTPEFFRLPYVGHLRGGVPGTIVHRRNEEIRYPAQRRAEDTVYLDEWRNHRYVELGEHCAHLFIRAFHGENTWERTHFTRRMRNSAPRLLTYAWYRWIRRDLGAHPRFILSRKAHAAFEQYLDDSFELELLKPPAR